MGRIFRFCLWTIIGIMVLISIFFPLFFPHFSKQG